MSQTHTVEQDKFRASNIDIRLNKGSDTVLGGLPVLSFNNFALTITNYSSSASPLVNINILGSEDNSYYYFIQQNVFPSGINAGQTLHMEFSTTSHYMQISVNTNIVANLDVYLIGTP